MIESYSVRVTKDLLVFSAAHFITFNGDCCERLHGHNYLVDVTIWGPLDENHYVVDFVALRDRLQQQIAELDHRVLLPTQHPQIRVAAGQTEVEATFQDRRWVFPRSDCALLPVANTTTELLARHLGMQLWDWIHAQGWSQIESLQVSVDENQGQWGTWRGSTAP